MNRRSIPEVEIERQLAFDLEHKRNDPNTDNLPTLHETEKAEFATALEAATPDELMSLADEHYAAARILFQAGLTWYAMFCGQQMVELYLKAFLRSRRQKVPTTHSLEKLLQSCRQADPECEFVSSVYLEAITIRFDPYNEVGRYPVARRKPKRAFSCTLPDTMWELDYLAAKMTACIPTKTGGVRKTPSPNAIGRTAGKSSLFSVLFRRYNMNVPDESLTIQAEHQPLIDLLRW